MNSPSLAKPNARNTALLLILDGWGHRTDTEHNAIAAANTPTWDRLLATCSHTLIDTSGLAVGLPSGQMGNSEVGHMNLGAGRVVYQSLTRIDKAVEDGSFADNAALNAAMDRCQEKASALHVFGLLSPGGIHSHEEQILALLDLAISRGLPRIYLHAFLDGRDTPPRSALASLQRAEARLLASGRGRIASLAGRFYAMDRDNRWDRVEPVYRMLADGRADFHAVDASAGLEAAYGRDEDDEFVQPTLIGKADDEPAIVQDGDAVIFMNFRADRARELTRCFVDAGFDGFERGRAPQLADFVSLTEYASDIASSVAFPPMELHNVLGEYLANQHKTQLRLAETEKYAHVTFFFNGGREEPFAGEDRILVPSPQVKTYDLKPEMAAPEVTDKLVEAIRSGEYDAIICNYANGDMVGHTGNWEAALKAVEVVDSCLARIVEAIEESDGELLITADHGNVEQMVNPENGQPLTSHTNGPVPLVHVGSSRYELTRSGSLCDLAPTLLSLMEMDVPAEMTGKVLVSIRPDSTTQTRTASA